MSVRVQVVITGSEKHARVTTHFVDNIEDIVEKKVAAAFAEAGGERFVKEPSDWSEKRIDKYVAALCKRGLEVEVDDTRERQARARVVYRKWSENDKLSAAQVLAKVIAAAGTGSLCVVDGLYVDERS